MNYRFNMQKAIEAAGAFVEKSGGKINVMKLVKLMYLLDRLSLEKRGMPVVGGQYFSMRNGPVTSEVLDLINAGKLANERNSGWEDFFTPRSGHEVSLSKSTGSDHLSQREQELIELVFQSHNHLDQWELSEWCHLNCGEWTQLETSRDQITLSTIAKAIGREPEEIEQIEQNAKEANRIAMALACV